MTITPRTELTDRELQVLHAIAAGLSNASIGRALSLSEDTVKTYARLLYRKLGAHDRAHAVALAFTRGVLTVDPGQGGLATANRVPSPVRADPVPGTRGTVTLTAGNDRDVALLASALYPQDRVAPWAITRCRDALARLVGA